jgi:pimeloyl-ACP methyl ester carboxylesterase
MTDDRIHRAVSADGTGIAARVVGEGPPLLFLPAGPGDSETSWGAVVPHVARQFTCYYVNTRGRGLSADHTDHSPRRLVEDVASFAASLDEPAGLVGWGNALWAQVAAANIANLLAVAAYDPAADEVRSEAIDERFVEVFGRARTLVDEGRPLDAARLFVDRGDVVYGEEEVAGGEPWDFWRASAPYVGMFLQEQQEAQSQEPSPTSPTALATIKVPVLVLVGDRSTSWFAASARHIIMHLRNARLRAIPAAAHFAPRTAPRAVADELV